MAVFFFFFFDWKPINLDLAKRFGIIGWPAWWKQIDHLFFEKI